MSTRPETEPAVRAVGLGKTFGAGAARLRAVDDVSLSVEPGEFIAIMGPSGCGKSTLLNMLSGLERPTSGRVEFDGQDVTGFSEGRWARLRAARVGVIFQAFNLIDNLSVLENIELPARLAGGSLRKVRARAELLAGELDLMKQLPSRPDQLSGGQQQRVAIARALINDPAVIFADEPTGALDSDAAEAVVDLLGQRHQASVAIVMVTHDPAVGAAAERVVHMRDGVIVADSPQLERRAAVAVAR